MSDPQFDQSGNEIEEIVCANCGANTDEEDLSWWCSGSTWYCSDDCYDEATKYE